jgi:quercetin dioxygenase-like cupin family protein
MQGAIHLRPFKSLDVIRRCEGIENYVIAGPKQQATSVKSGITRMAPGTSVPLHSHNCEEVVTMLEGSLDIVLGNQSFKCGKYDSYFIGSNVPHEFSNQGEIDALLMIVYGSSTPSRTFLKTGQTVLVGDENDVFDASKN